MQTETLAKLCGYGNGWCKVSNLSWWECEKIYGKCRYFLSHHPAYPMIVIGAGRELARDSRLHTYDEKYSKIFAYDEADPGIIKVDDIGKCDYCKLPTSFYDVNILVYICSTMCRKMEYKKLEEMKNIE